ncbi:MAG: hypothetical protein HY231_20570 [Acidobacteria bacterium]|nr:hypothetical protein [Acidobacteriota bacterium]
MKKLSRKTPFLMLLVLSLIASQLFLKAFGINLTPSLGTLAHSWSRVASAVGFVYQPGFAAELDALSHHLFCDEKGQPVDREEFCGEMACYKGNDFDFEMPPAIEITEPDYGVEPEKPGCWKSAYKQILLQDKKLETEVVEIATDADENSADADGKSEGTAVSSSTPATGEAATGAAEADAKTSVTTVENKIFMTTDDERVAPKADKIRKPCPEQRPLKREELQRLEENLKNFEERKMNYDIPLVQALQTLKRLEKTKHFRIIVRLSSPVSPHAFTSAPSSLAGLEESEL